MAAPLLAWNLEQTQIAKYHTKGGHGFTAEDANHLVDRLKGSRAEVVGITNELNGADRVVDGILIQSKYYRSASETIASAFDPASGAYRYTDQLLEVPKDQYDDCVKLMRSRIAQGKVPGIENPSDAEKIVKKGTVTYQQARNIAKAGKIESILFDASSQAVTSSYVFAVSFVIAFAHGVWRGEGVSNATKGALLTGFSSGGATLVTGVLAAQVLRTRGAAVGVVMARNGVRSVAGSSLGRGVVEKVAVGSLGRAVYGAAAVNHVSKLIRTNVVTSVIAAAVTTIPDFYRVAFRRSISWRQFGKNTSINSVGIAAGTAGWLGGAAVGGALGSIVPIFGTAVGGIAGGIAGALGCHAVVSKGARRVADMFVKDDSVPLLKVVDEEFERLAFEYLITDEEAVAVSGNLRRIVSPKWLRSLYRKTRADRSGQLVREIVNAEFEPHFEAIMKDRAIVQLPSIQEIDAELLNVAEFVDSTCYEKTA